MYLYKKSAIFTLLTLFSLIASAQKTPSLYSFYGLGEQYGTPYINNRGMGGSGLANFNPLYMNFMNPAAMVFTELTAFDAGIFLESKNYTTSTLNENRNSGSLGYFSLAFPVYKKKWVIGAEVTPYSFVNYNNTREVEDPNFISPITKSFIGNGGLSRATITNSFMIVKGLSIGISAHYYFGQITRSEISRLGDFVIASDTVTAVYRSSLQEKTNYSDFALSSGIFFTHKFKNNNFLNLAATYELGTRLGGNRSISLNKLDPSGNQIVIGLDTAGINVIQAATDGYSQIPSKLGVGLAFGKSNKYTILMDGYYQDWSTFSDFGIESQNLQESFRLNLGTEFVPNYSSLDNYLARVTYRAGAYFENAPFIINNTNIYNFGVTFGASFPLRSFSSFNVAAEIGQMGTSADGLVQENYFRINLGVTIFDRWFIRQKFD